MDLNKKNIKTIMLLITFTVALVFAFLNIPFFMGVISKIITLLFPFILGLCIAFVLNVPMSLFEDKLLKKIKNTKLKRIISIILSLLLVVLIVIFVLMMVIPDFAKAITSLINTLPNSLENLNNWLNSIFEKYPNVKDQINSIDWDNITNNAVNFLKNSSETLLTNSVSFVSSFISSIVSFGIGVVFSIYILAQKESLSNQVNKVMKAYLPNKVNKKINYILSISNNTFSKFISVQCLEAAILGLLLFIALSIFRLPYALAISSLTAVTALIPVFGALIACAFGIILIGVTNPIQAIWFFIVFQFVQQIEGNLIYPRVVGKSVGLPPLWVMLAVTVGGSAFGLVGMLISVPVSSIIYSLFKEKVNEKLKEK